MIRVLMGHQNGVESGHVRDVCRKHAGVEQNSFAPGFDQQARMSKMCDPHAGNI